MKLIRLLLPLFIAFNCCILPLSNDVFAYGQWHSGIVTKSPWTDIYTYIKIDNVRYRIMRKAKVRYVYKKNGAYYKDSGSISSIRPGDDLLVKVDGKTIYQIDIKR